MFKEVNHKFVNLPRDAINVLTKCATQSTKKRENKVTSKSQVFKLLITLGPFDRDQVDLVDMHSV